MKKFLLALLAIVFIATGSPAFEFVVDGQSEDQGGSFVVNPTSSLEIADQHQDQFALGSADPGDVVTQSLYQQNLIVDSQTAGVPGNRTIGVVNLNQEQLITGNSTDGAFGTANDQDSDFIQGSLNTGPGFAISGHGSLIEQDTSAFALGAGASSDSESTLHGNTAYLQEATNAMGFTQHHGTQTFDIHTESSAAVAGADADSLDAWQAGGSLSTNNQAGTQMDSGQAAGANVVTVGNGSHGSMSQTHGFTQTVSNGPFHQTQSGVITTTENF